MKQILQDNQTKTKTTTYAGALEDYASGKNKFAKSVSNPVYNVVSEYNKNNKEAQTRKKWERAAVFTGLNNVFQGGSAIATAISGIKPQKIDDSAFNYSIEQINKSDNRALDNYNRIYKASLDDAIRQNERTEKVQDNYLKSMNELRKDAEEQEKFNKKLADSSDARNAKIVADSIKKSKSSRAASTSKPKTTTAKERAVDMYVYNSGGKKVALHKEDMTKLHQIGKLNNLDYEYKNAKSNQEREKEYDIMMQRAYLLYDKYKKEKVSEVK